MSIEATVNADANVTARPTSRSLIAPAWHTVVFIAIFVGVSVAAAFFQHAVNQHPPAVAPGDNAVPRYISVVVFEMAAGALRPHGRGQARSAVARSCWWAMGDTESIIS